MKTYRAHGKVILAGEHAVVRGGAAVVFPLLSRSLELRAETSEGLEVHADSDALSSAFRKALHAGLRGRELTGHFRLQSNIPLGGGLGSSAALSVATARFLGDRGLLTGDLFQEALRIENLFHGQSSGIDVAAALSEQPIRFQKGVYAPISSGAFHFYLHDTGLRASTKTCVEKVASQGREDLDRKMHVAAEQGAEALAQGDASKLSQAMESAEACFIEWDLIPPEAASLARKVREAGALAVKPTGSGGGGFLLSCWEKPAPQDFAGFPV